MTSHAGARSRAGTARRGVEERDERHGEDGAGHAADGTDDRGQDHRRHGLADGGAAQVAPETPATRRAAMSRVTTRPVVMATTTSMTAASSRDSSAVKSAEQQAPPGRRLVEQALLLRQRPGREDLEALVAQRPLGAGDAAGEAVVDPDLHRPRGGQAATERAA